MGSEPTTVIEAVVQALQTIGFFMLTVSVVVIGTIIGNAVTNLIKKQNKKEKS